jgi:hypothetical protein
VKEKIRAFSLSLSLSRQLCRKSFTQAGNLRQHEKSKQHQLRLMNGTVVDDFFNNTTTTTIDNDNRRFERIRQHRRQQQQSQNDSNASNALHHKIGSKIFNVTSKLCIWRCPNWKSTVSSKSAWPIIFVSCAHENRFSRKRFPERDWLAEHKVWHIEVDLDRYFNWLYAYSIYCRNFSSTAFSHSYCRRSHQQSAVLDHNKERRIVDDG